MPPALMAGIRWLAAGTLLAAIERVRGHRLPSRAAWPGLAVAGLLFVVGGNGFVVWAEQWVPSGLTAVLLATSPFWMVGAEAVLQDGERPHGWTWLGLAIGFAGIVLLVWPDMVASGPSGASFLWGAAGLQLACLTWAIGSARERRRGAEQDHTLAGAALQMLVGGAILTLLGFLAGEPQRLAFSVRSVSALAYLVVFGSVVGYSSYLYTLQYLPVSTVSLYAYINPIIAVVLGVIVAGETFGGRSLLASGVVLAGVALVRATARWPRR
jgi:drug/metabolite transporter (DMT)-like permease